MTTHASTPTMAFESLRGRSKRHLARMAGFYLSVLVFVFFWLLAFNFELVALVRAWFDPALAGNIHFVHNMALAAWVLVWGLAMVVQFYRPARRVSAMQVALVLTVTDAGLGPLLTVVRALDPSLTATAPDLSGWLFFVPVFVAAALHPARGELLHVRGLDRDSVDPVLLGLAALAAVPLLLYAANQTNLQFTLNDIHAAIGHYATVTLYVVSIVGLALLASFRNRGRRDAAYAASLLAVVLAATSLFRPELASAVGTTWSVLAVLWALAVVGAYEWSARRDPQRTVQSPEEPVAAN